MKIVIAGAGEMGSHLAKMLSGNGHDITVIDSDQKLLADVASLADVITVEGDSTTFAVLRKASVRRCDLFIAVNHIENDNVVAAMLAKRMGVKKVIAEVENMNYINLAESIGIDTIINKKLVTASNIFRFTMSTDVQAIKCLMGSDAEVLEFIVKPNSPATKNRIRDLGLPEDVIVGGIVRGDKVFIAVGSTEINAYDRVVVFAMPASVARIGTFFN